jgi:hypothetical protein
VPNATDEQVVALLPALENAARADPTNTASRFVPPRIGILEQTAANRQMFVFGRRGVGKSMLLRTIEQDRAKFGAEVLFIDVETLRGRPYPDVLIELLIKLLDALKDGLNASLKHKGRQAQLQALPTRWRMRRLRRELAQLLAEPQQATRTVTKGETHDDTRAGGVVVPPVKGFWLLGKRSRSRQRESRSDAEFTETKMEGLLGAVEKIRRLFEQTSVQLGGTPTLVVLDDFYHVKFEDQPQVLAYLHQVVKNLPIYLKVCGVRHRINEFAEGDPPTGLQIGHDAGDVSLDITLEEFAAAQRFLEAVLNGVAADTGLKVEDLVTGTGRERLVLGSGGVARDYLDLVSKALRKASERESRQDRPHNRITAEDVNEVATALFNRKQEDLKRDVGPGADRLRERQSDIVRFCLDHNHTNVFLVEGVHLTETDWGKEIETLADLRLMHKLGDFSLPSPGWRGRRFVGYTLDLTHWTGVRSERIHQIEFWKSGERQNLRRTALVYDPDRPQGQAQHALRRSDAATSDPVNWDQPPLPFDEEEATT